MAEALKEQVRAKSDLVFLQQRNMREVNRDRHVRVDFGVQIFRIFRDFFRDFVPWLSAGILSHEMISHDELWAVRFKYQQVVSRQGILVRRFEGYDRASVCETWSLY